MASARTNRIVSTVLSILGHAAIVAALTFSVPLASRRPEQPEAVMINTKMLDENAVQAEMARIEEEREAEAAAEAAERQRLQDEADRLAREREAEQRELERVRQEREEAEREAAVERIRVAEEAKREEERLLALETERRQREAEDAERQRREQEERQRLAAEQAEKERQERLAREAEERRLREEEERRREEEIARQERIARIEAEAALAVQAENARRDLEQRGLLDQWLLDIQDKIERNWIRPPSAVDGLNCVVRVRQLPSGDVTGVSISECNSNDATIIRSIENAVLQASPLPPPPDRVLFDPNLNVRFQPDFRPE